MDILLHETLLLENDLLKEESDMKDLYIECMNIEYSNILYEAPSFDFKGILEKIWQKIKEFIAFVKYKFKQWIRKIGMYLQKFYLFIVKNDYVLRYFADRATKFKQFEKKFIAVYNKSELDELIKKINDVQSDINKNLGDDIDKKDLINVVTDSNVVELNNVFSSFDNTMRTDGKNILSPEDERYDEVDVTLRNYKEIKNTKDISAIYKSISDAVKNIDSKIVPLEKKVYELEKELIELRKDPEINGDKINTITTKIQAYQSAIQFCMKAVSFLFKFGRTGVRVYDENKKFSQKLEEFYYDSLDTIRKLKGKEPVDRTK